MRSDKTTHGSSAVHHRARRAVRVEAKGYPREGCAVRPLEHHLARDGPAVRYHRRDLAGRRFADERLELAVHLDRGGERWHDGERERPMQTDHDQTFLLAMTWFGLVVKNAVQPTTYLEINN